MRSGRARQWDMTASAIETKILLTFEETKCSFCTFPLKVGKGIVVQDCLHPFCKPCLVTWIENAQTVSIKCPVDCGAMLLESEVKALVKPQVFEKLEKLSYDKIVSDAPNAFKCQTVNCNGLCFFGDGSKVFLCPQCNGSNCIPCKAIHNGFSCEDYQTEKKKCYDSNIPNPEEYLRNLVEKQKQTNGFEQLVASGWIPAVLQRPDGGQDKTKFYDNLIDSMAQQRIFVTSKEFDCTICYCDVPVGGGVILQDCFHLFCKDCLISHIEHNDDPQVRCPHPSCTSILSPREISALLPANVLEKVNKRSWSLAEAVIGSKFHCLTIDCSGFCELEGNVNAFQCPLCLKTNCIGCNAIHENLSCADFKNRIVQNVNDQLSNKAVDNLIAKGMAMRCTRCSAAVQKDVGCDWIVCPMCKTELCWATKGPRWGPKVSKLSLKINYRQFRSN
ncbi:unnamed protein product [Allacma fusca]|uniref:Uncharacterized protein n=1 Tax=Allacma fusca TaxID=39272 RepID=A0A8J2LJF8_9HEXA|nr:unnamed protein product [Allacma fusca]